MNEYKEKYKYTVKQVEQAVKEILIPDKPAETYNEYLDNIRKLRDKLTKILDNDLNENKLFLQSLENTSN